MKWLDRKIAAVVDDKFDSHTSQYHRKAEVDDGIVDCESCGCRIKKALAVEGEHEIRDVVSKTFSVPINDGGHWGWAYLNMFNSVVGRKEEYIHTPYYCKRCAPKKGKKND